jgi:hypothetical protein
MLRGPAWMRNRIGHFSGGSKSGGVMYHRWIRMPSAHGQGPLQSGVQHLPAATDPGHPTRGADVPSIIMTSIFDSTHVSVAQS